MSNSKQYKNIMDDGTDMSSPKTKRGKGDQTQFLHKIAELEADLQKVASEIDKVEDEKAVVTNQLKKALADYQNLENGIDNRVESRLFQMKRKVAADLIEVCDDMRFAVEASKDLSLDEKGSAWLEGLLGTFQKTEKALGELGVLPMNVRSGESFDSARHEAIAVVDLGEAGKIHEVVQEGYVLDDNVIRPAKVVVNKKA